MVQGGLLTAHPGSVHGDGEAPGDESSLRQGAGTGSRREVGDRKKESLPRVSVTGCKYRRKGKPGGTRGSRRPGGAP